MQESGGVPNLQTKLNYLDSFKSYCNSSNLAFLSLGMGWGKWVGGYLGWTTIVCMSSGVFRGKESSNRIELSQLVSRLIEFLVFWDSCSSREVAGRWGVSDGMGVSQNMCTCMHTHVYMYRNCKWPPPWRYLCLSCLHFYNMHACVHAWDIPHTPIPTPTQIHSPTTPTGGPPESVKIK